MLYVPYRYDVMKIISHIEQMFHGETLMMHQVNFKLLKRMYLTYLLLKRNNHQRKNTPFINLNIMNNMKWMFMFNFLNLCIRKIQQWRDLTNLLNNYLS